jgi:DNA-binding GntR family transcriptional regulator
MVNPINQHIFQVDLAQTFRRVSMKVVRAAAPVREQTVIAIRSAIMAGEFEPGQRLIEREICEALDVSRNTLREAYRQLEAEGFLEIRPHKGPAVAQISDDQAREIYELREALECFAVRLFTDRATDQEIREILKAGRALEHAILGGDSVKLLDAKNCFYEQVFEGARNQLLHDQAKHLYSRLAGLRARSLSHPGRAEQSAAETREVMKAISAREANLAEELWRKHIRNAATAAFQEPAALPAKKELAGLGVRP